MEGLANLLLAPDGGGGPLPQSDGRWAPWRGAGADQPPADPPGAATEFGHSGQDVDVPVGCKMHMSRDACVAKGTAVLVCCHQQLKGVFKPLSNRLCRETRCVEKRTTFLASR